MNSVSDLKKQKFLPLFTYLLSVIALFIFLYGFFPLNYSLKLKENSGGQKNIQQRYVDKLAFIIIDALRYDFVMPGDGRKYMPYTVSSILNNEACYFVTKAHSPTVTLPRLKAITSGSVSSYIDVVLNFMTPAFEEDNFINIAASKGLKIVFYGDDTWLKLFPNSFIRSEGTNSFFTYDYVEVDNNVTRHIADELKRNDWDIIILHYLGLDHIGHTEGPNSALVKPKLLEMDNIVMQFSHHFKNLEKSQGLKTMLIVTGDHGMKDSGSHGGVTYPEVTVPLISIGHSCGVLPGWPEDYTPLQIDLAPTLSALFGLPIPVGSMGKIIPSLLHYMQRDEILKQLEINRQELNKFETKFNKVSGINSISSELEHWLQNDKRNEEVGKNITNKYFQYLNEISQKLVTSNSDFKLIFLILGVISLWIFLSLFLFQLFMQCPVPMNSIHWLLIIGTALHALSLISSSFIEEEHQTWYFLWATFCVFSFLEILCQMSKLSSSFNTVKYLSPWIILGVIHRILRKLNQTGDKWALLPDIKFYLHSKEGQPWLFAVFLLGIGMIFLYAVLEKCPISQLMTFGVSLSAVICYRIATGNFKLQCFTALASRDLSVVFIFWAFLAAFTLQTACYQTPFYLVWLLFISLFLRPHNIILLPLQVFTSKRLHKLFHKPDDIIWNNIAHIWLGNVFYFYQGNGNSLSNVDVAAGFVGVETYKPAYAGAMIAAHNFNSLILSFLLSPKSDLIVALLRMIPLTLYCTILMFQLNHLFIWSVFSPKLLFDSSATILYLFLLAIKHFLNLKYLFTLENPTRSKFNKRRGEENKNKIF